jgi:hypothetical protein
VPPVKKGRSTRHACAGFLVASHESSQIKCKYLHYLLGQRDKSLDPLLGVATHFAPHAWACRFKDLFSTLEGHSAYTYNTTKTWPLYWIDLFIKNQHGKAPSTVEVKSAIRATLK